MMKCKNPHHVTVHGEPVCRHPHLFREGYTCGCESKAAAEHDAKMLRLRYTTRGVVKVVPGECPNAPKAVPA